MRLDLQQELLLVISIIILIFNKNMTFFFNSSKSYWTQGSIKETKILKWADHFLKHLFHLCMYLYINTLFFSPVRFCTTILKYLLHSNRINSSNLELKTLKSIAKRQKQHSTTTAQIVSLSFCLLNTYT